MGKGKKGVFTCNPSVSLEIVLENIFLSKLYSILILPSQGGVEHCIFSLKTNLRTSGGVVVKLLAGGARGPGFDSRSRRYNEICYLLLPSRDMAVRS